MEEYTSIKLEGTNTPDILLNSNEVVLMDVSQGIRDLGLAGIFLRHKGRLIVTNQRAIFFKKKTKDHEIEQLNINHIGYLKFGHDLNFRQLITGTILIILSTFTLIASLSLGGIAILLSLILMMTGLAISFTSRIQGITLSGSGDKIFFASKSVPSTEITKVITIVAANS